MAHGNANHSSGPGLYIVVALVLGVATYLEYYIVEFPPIWLSPSWVMFWLVVMSLAKFLMVIWFFMHLRDDDKLYTGFFTSGFVIAMGTFVALAAMFLLPRAVAPAVAATEPPAVVDHTDEPTHDTLDLTMRELIDTDGLARPLAARAGAPRPKDQTLRITPPAAPEELFGLRLDDDALEDLALAEDEPEPDPDGDPAAAAEPGPEEPEPGEPTLADAPDPTFDAELGAQAYTQNCSACHQPNGQGIPGAFPPLAGHAADLYEMDGGRTYLIDVVLNGLQGPIEARGQTYNGVMPSFVQLDDDRVAAVLNHVVAGLDADGAPEAFDAIRPDEVAAERGRDLSPSDVHALRGELAPVEDAAADAAEEGEPADAEPDEAEPAPADAADAEAEPDEAEPEEAPEPEAEEPADAADADPTFDRDLATQVFAQNCSACHQPNGQGIPGAFPPLAGHAADLYEMDGGRTYLIDVVLNGLQGPIEARGQTYNGLMPPFPQLDDDQIAAVVNHAVAGFDPEDEPDDFDAIRSDEVAGERGKGLSPSDVHGLRQELGLD